MPNRATPRQPAGTAQEAVGLSPGAHLPPDARGNSPRKNPRGPASPDALLQATDACGYLPQKKPRTPVPARQERSRRGRPYPQNRDGSGYPGIAEGSLPRLAPEGRGFEQEIILLRSMINRLLSRRPLNHTYISRYMRLLIQAQSVNNRIPRQLTDEQEVDSLIKKLFHKRVDDGQLSFLDLLPVRTAQPGEKWWPWRQLMSVEERRRDGLIGPDDRWPSNVDEYLDEKAANEAEKAAFEAEIRRDMEAVFEGMFANDPVLSLLYDPDEESPDPDDDYDPDDEDPHSETSVIPDPLPVIPDPDRGSIPRGGMGGPTPSPSTGEGRGEGDPLPGAESAHPEQGRRVERIPGGAVPSYLPPPSPVGATGWSPGWVDHAPPPSPKPRIARGRPPP